MSERCQGIKSADLTALRTYPSILTPGREFCFTEKDLRRFNELLVEAFPDICFLRELPMREERDTTVKPPSTASQWLHELPAGVYTYVFQGVDWRPDWTVTGRFQQWRPSNIVMPNGFLSVGRGVQTWLSRVEDDIEYLDDGRLYTRCYKGNDEQMRIGRKVKRLVAKVATNRKQELWKFNPLRLQSRTEKGSDFWIGHDAREWLLAKPNRFTGAQPTTLTRPYDD
jgi:hypothetical protein